MNSLGNALSNSSALEKQESVTSIAGNYSCLILFDLAWPYTLSQPTHNLASDPSCTCLPRTDFTHRLIKFVVLKPHRGCALLHTECHTHTQLHTIIHSYIQSYTSATHTHTQTHTHTNHTHTHTHTHQTHTRTHTGTHTPVGLGLQLSDAERCSLCCSAQSRCVPVYKHRCSFLSTFLF